MSLPKSAEFEKAIEESVQRILSGSIQGKKKRLAIVASKGTLDFAYPPLILASTAVSMGWETGVFCTFYGLDILNRKKYKRMKVASIGNPAMPVPVPSILGILPGMTGLATSMMKRWMAKSKIPRLDELVQISQEGGVRFFACTTTLGVMNIDKSDIIEGVEFAGAAGFLDFASEASVTMFI